MPRSVAYKYEYNHALNMDDGAYLQEEYMHLIGRWRHSRVFKKPRLQLYITSVEDTRLQWRNVGSGLQFDWALYSFLNQSNERKYEKRTMLDK
jgi:hypothetical protein